MPNILVLYATDYGSTKKYAEAVAAGAQTVPGTSVTLKTVEEATAEDLIATDGLIVGSPTHMGSCDWRVKKFIDQICSKVWAKDQAVGKVGAVFATGGGLGNSGGGVEINLLSILANFAEMGLIYVPLPKNTPGYALAGLHWGPNARTGTLEGKPKGVDEAQLETAKHHGANVARVAAALAGKELFAK